PVEQRKQHDCPDKNQNGRIGHGSWPDETDARLAGRIRIKLSGMGIVADQTASQVNPVHHVVAGINAEGTGNAFKLEPVADLNAHRTDGNALVAINAMTAVIPRLPFLVRPARFTPRRV